jgi:hypothetical protein
MYVEQPKRIRRMRRMRRKKEKRNGKTREASQQESSVEKNPRGRVLAGTVYSSSCGNFWFLVVQLDLVGLVWRWVGLGGALRRLYEVYQVYELYDLYRSYEGEQVKYGGGGLFSTTPTKFSSELYSVTAVTEQVK